jgi:hypothetical protein
VRCYSGCAVEVEAELELEVLIRPLMCDPLPSPLSSPLLTFSIYNEHVSFLKHSNHSRSCPSVRVVQYGRPGDRYYWGNAGIVNVCVRVCVSWGMCVYVRVRVCE